MVRIILCLEVWRERRVREAEKMRVVGRIAEDSYHPPCLDVFKINKRDGNN